VSDLPGGYELVRVLGHGGFGEVCLVRDATGGELAIKRLARLDPTSIARFKNEFRLLQHVRHPSLVRLHKLIGTERGWFLVMEYVQGETFTARIREGAGARALPTLPQGGSGIVLLPPDSGDFDEARLRCALHRLVRGVIAIHEAGIVHRDLKPHNVLVAPDGRVAILDFGLAATLSSEASFAAKQGTPGYMAPEQARGGAVTPAVDWYAVGVMLFEALTGRLPYVGSVRDIVDAQLAGSPPDPALYAVVPEDLRRLCIQLLAAEPAARPDGATVLAAIGEAGDASGTKPRYVGWATERASIVRALDETLCDGAPIAMHVIGSAGAGKTTLLASGLADAAARGAVVLSGRCYEHEALPYKAIDPVIDALTTYLLQLSTEEIAAVMPRDAAALCRVFPTVAQIAAFAGAPADDTRLDEARAIDALRELLGRIAERAPVVLAIDDLQWGCADSARVLARLLGGADAPRVLVLLGYRPQAANLGLALLRDRLDAIGLRRRSLVLRAVPRAA
jgi:hypothetical protein